MDIILRNHLEHYIHKTFQHIVTHIRLSTPSFTPSSNWWTCLLQPQLQWVDMRAPRSPLGLKLKLKLKLFIEAFNTQIYTIEKV